MTASEIREGRHRLNLTQRALGDLLGVSGAAVARWEKGDTVPTFGHQKRLRAILDGRVSTDDPLEELRKRVAELESELLTQLSEAERRVQELERRLNREGGG